ncbi:pyrroloquinoline quinone precursor peptide PqqA [Kribbella sp. NBC_00382]
MVETTQQRETWIAPDFLEFETPTEVTSYAARID